MIDPLGIALLSAVFVIALALALYMGKLFRDGLDIIDDCERIIRDIDRLRREQWRRRGYDL